MSTTVEQRVVKFEFNNANFEKNVNQSIGTLDNLKKTLDESTSGKAFDGLTEASKKLNLSAVTESVQVVTEKFSALEQIAIGALRNIGANIQQHLVQTLKAVTFDNISSGWDRFAQKTESVATIMAAIADEDYGDVDKLDYVNGVLEKLAWFSDETSYNFNDMTDNIGKFVAAGLDLDTSTTAMMGIANWAATAGQNAGTASRAMYQLSQAMGSGSIKLQDWKSIEVANMATKEVKEMLIEYGKLMGTVETVMGPNGPMDMVTWVDAMSGKEKSMEINVGNFRDTLTKSGWLTADVFSAAMGEYASYSEALNAIINNPANKKMGLYATDVMKKMDLAMKKSKKTGQTLDEIMLKDYGINIMVEDENGNLVSAMADVTELGMRAMEAAQKARTFTQAMDSIKDAASTKWSQAFEKIFGDMEEATELWSYLAEVLYDWFAEPLNKMNEALLSWKDAGGRDSLFGYVDEEGELVNGAFQNIVDAIYSYKEAIGSGLSRVFNPDGLDAEDFGKVLADLTERFKNFTEKLILKPSQIKKVSDAIKTIVTPLKSFGEAFGSVLGAASRFSGGFIKAFSRAFTYKNPIENAQKLEKALRSIGKNPLGKNVKALENPLKTISKFISNIWNVESRFFKDLKPSSGAISKLTTIFKGLKSVLDILFAPLRLINTWLEKLLNPKSDKIERVASFIGGPLLEAFLWLPSKISEAVTWLADFIRNSETLSTVKDIFVNIGTAIWDFLSGFGSAAWEVIGPLFDGAKSAVSGFFKSLKESSILGPIFTAIGNFLKSIKEWFEDKDWYEIGKAAFEGIVTIFTSVGDAVKSLIEKIKGNEKVTAFFETIGNALSGCYEKIKTWITENLDFSSIPAFFESLGTAIGGAITKIGDSKIFKTIADGITKVYNAVKTWIEDNIDFSSVGGFFTSLGKALGDLVKKFKDSEAFEKITTSLKNMFAAIKEWVSENIDFSSVGGFFSSLGSGLAQLFRDFKDSEFFSSLTENLKNAYEAVKTWMTENLNLGGLFDFFENLSFEALGENISAFADKVWNAVTKIAGAIGEFLGLKKKTGSRTSGEDGETGLFGRKKKISGQAGDVDKRGEGLDIGPVGELLDGKPVEALTIIRSMFDEATPILDGLTETMTKASGAIDSVGSVSDAIKSGFTKIKEFIEWAIDQAGEILPKISGLLLSLGGLKLGQGFKKIGDGFKAIGKGIKGIGDSAGKFAKAAEFNAIADIVKNMALLIVAIAGSLFIMSKIDNMDKAKEGILVAAGVIAEVFVGLSALTKVASSGGGIKELGNAAILSALPLLVGAIAAMIVAISVAMGSMVKATNSLGKGKSLWDDVIWPMVMFIGEIFGGLIALMAVSKGEGARTLKGAKGAIVAMSAAVKILAEIALSLAEADDTDMGKAVLRLGAIVGLLDTLIISFGNMVKGSKTSALLMGTLAFAAIVAGLYVLSNLVIELTNETNRIGNAGGGLLSGIVALGIVVGILELMVHTIFIPLSNLSIGQISGAALGLVAISLAFALISQAVIGIINAASSPEITRAGSGGGTNPLLLVAGALLAIIAIAVLLEQMATNVDGTNMLVAAGAMAIMAVAMTAIVAVVLALSAFAAQDLGAVAAGVIAFVVVLGALVAAALLLNATDGAAMAFLIFSAAVLAFGLAIMAIAKGIDMFVDTVIKVGKTVQENRGVIRDGIFAIAETLVECIPAFTMGLGAIITALVLGIAASAPMIIDAFFTLVDVLLTKFNEWAPTILPKLKTTIMYIIDFVGELFEDSVLPWIETLFRDIMTIIFNLLSELWEDIKAFIKQVLEGIGELLVTILDVLGDIATSIYEFIKTLVGGLIDLIKDLVLQILTTVAELSVALIETIGTIGASIVDTIASLLNTIIDAIESVITNILDSVSNILDSIANLAQTLYETISTIVNGIINLITETITNIIESISSIVNTIITTIGELGTNLVTTIGNIIQLILDTIDGLLTSLFDIINNILSFITTTLTDIYNFITTTLTNILDFTSTFLNDVVNKLTELATNIIDSITGLLNDIIDSITSIFDNILESVRTLLNDIIAIVETATELVDAVFDLLTDVVNKIAEFGTTIKDAAIQLLHDFVDGITEATDIVLNGFHDLIVGKDGNGGIIKVIGDTAGDVGRAVPKIITAFVDGIADGADTVMQAFIDLFRGKMDDTGTIVRAGIFDRIVELASEFVAAVVRLINGMADIIRLQGPEIYNALWNLVDAIISGIPLLGQIYQLGKDAVAALLRGLNEEGETLEESLEWGHIDVMKELGLTVEDAGSEQALRDKWRAIGQNVVEAIGYGIQNHDKAALEAIDLVNQGLIDEAKKKLDIKSPSKVFKEIGKNVVLGLSGGITDNESTVTNSASALLRSFKSQFTSKETKDSIGSTGGRITSFLSSGMKGAYDLVTGAVGYLSAKIPGAVTDSKETIKQAGGRADKYIASGVKDQDNKQSVLDAIVFLGTAMKNSFNGIDFSTSGDNFVAGVKAGIDRSAWIAKQKAVTLARETKYAFDTELEIASPSKKMMESGKFFDMGLANGIDKFARDPIGSAEDVSNALSLAMTTALYMAQAALQDEDYTPVITPVVDLSSVQNGMYQMGTMFDQYNGYSVNAAMRSRFDPYQNYDGSEKNDPNLDLLTSVGGVTSKLDEMIAKLTQLRVYLDTGTLVGGIVDQVDNTLGTKAIYAGRGAI